MFAPPSSNEFAKRYQQILHDRPRWRKASSFVRFLVASVLFLIVAIIIFPACYGLGRVLDLIKWCLLVIHRRIICREAENSGRKEMSPQDSVWMGDSPKNLMIINAVLWLDGKLKEDVFQQIVYHRMIKRVNPRTGKLLMPRFTRKIVKRGQSIFWEPDTGFDVRNHVFLVNRTPFSTPEEAKAYVEAEIVRPLPEERPRWQMQLLSCSSSSIDPLWKCRTLILFRIHHSMADGVSLVQILLQKLMDKETQEQPADPVTRMGKSNTKGILPILKAIFWTGYYAAEKLLIFPDQSCLRNRKISGIKKISWTYKFPVNQIKIFRQTLGCTVNDIMSSIIAGGFRRYIMEQTTNSSKSRKSFKVTSCVPINVRSSSTDIKMENHFSIILLPFAVDEADMTKRLAKTKYIMDDIKNSSEPLSMYIIVKGLQAIIPSSLCRWLIDITAMRTTLVFTNVPGPLKHCKLGGITVREIIFWVPSRSSLGVGISVFSYGGSFRVGVVGDSAVLPQPDLLSRCIEQEYEDYCSHIAGSDV